MSRTFQIALDSSDPHDTAHWWAQTLDWQVEPSNPDFIREMVAQGHAHQDETVDYNGTLVWRDGAALTDPDHPGAPRLLVQRVPEAKTTKNRMHLDITVDTGTLDAERDALISRGATFLHEATQGPHRWYTLSDPWGNEFCISEPAPSS